MMRFAEIIENITATGSLSPAEYAPIAQQRDAAQQQKLKATRQSQQQTQQANQQQLQAKRRAVKPKKIRWHRPKKRPSNTRRK